MKLSGNYTVDELIRTLQGNFSCREFTKDSRGRYLPEDKQYIRLEVFFIALEIYPKKGEVVISKIENDDKGSSELRPLVTLKAATSE